MQVIEFTDRQKNYYYYNTINIFFINLIFFFNKNKNIYTPPIKISCGFLYLEKLYYINLILHLLSKNILFKIFNLNF